MAVTTLTHAQVLDAQDALADYRAQFHLACDASGAPQRYFCGHSLGLQPRNAEDYVRQELDDWRRLAVEGHFAGKRPWLSYHERLTPALAQLCGAAPLEVVAMNSLTVNLHLLLVSFFKPTRERYKILIERDAFPSDRYAVVSQLNWHGLDSHDALLEVAPRAGEDALRTEDVQALLDREGARIAVVLLPGVQYLTGQALDMATIARDARQRGCIVGFDLAHAIGNLPLALHDWNVDFAVWCGYKYLNGGPGAIGGAFVHERHAREDLPRFAGWWGHDKASRFAMPHTLQALPGAEGWQISNPPILAMAPLLASLELFERAGMQALRDKSLRLTGFLETLIHERLRGVDILTPPEPHARGAQLSLRFDMPRDRAKHLHVQLMQAGYISDWREPNVMRIAPAPLYNTFEDAWMLVDALAKTIVA